MCSLIRDKSTFFSVLLISVLFNVSSGRAVSTTVSSLLLHGFMGELLEQPGGTNTSLHRVSGLTARSLQRPANITSVLEYKELIYRIVSFFSNKYPMLVLLVAIWAIGPLASDLAKQNQIFVLLCQVRLQVTCLKFN